MGSKSLQTCSHIYVKKPKLLEQISLVENLNNHFTETKNSHFSSCRWGLSFQGYCGWFCRYSPREHHSYSDLHSSFPKTSYFPRKTLKMKPKATHLSGDGGYFLGNQRSLEYLFLLQIALPQSPACSHTFRGKLFKNEIPLPMYS